MQEAEQLRRALRRLRQTCVGQGCEQGLLHGAPPSACLPACALCSVRADQLSTLSLCARCQLPWLVLVVAELRALRGRVGARARGVRLPAQAPLLRGCRRAAPASASRPQTTLNPTLHPPPAHRPRSRRRRARGAAGALDGDSSSACAGSEDCGSGAESDASVDDITAELGEGLSLSARFPVRLRAHLPPAQAAGAARLRRGGLPHGRPRPAPGLPRRPARPGAVDARAPRCRLRPAARAWTEQPGRCAAITRDGPPCVRVCWRCKACAACAIACGQHTEAAQAAHGRGTKH